MAILRDLSTNFFFQVKLSFALFEPYHSGAFWFVGARIGGKPTFRFVSKFDIFKKAKFDTNSAFTSSLINLTEKKDFECQICIMDKGCQEMGTWRAKRPIVQGFIYIDCSENIILRKIKVLRLSWF